MKNYSNIYKPNKKNLAKCCKILRNHGICALPTETVYGLAGNAYSSKAIRKIYKLKKRPKNNPLIVHFDSLKSIEKETENNIYLRKIYSKFSPGPITYVLKLRKYSKISKILTSKSGTIACRVPANNYFKKVIKMTGLPLAAPSANLSNQVSPTSPFDVYEEFKNNIKFILEGTRSNIGLESTVINLIGKPKILRPGKISKIQIKKIINTVSVNKSKEILSPGQFKKHYSPGIPIYLNRKKNQKNGAFLAFGKTKIQSKDFFYLSKKRSLNEAARNLYLMLRIIKKKGYKNISVANIPNKSIGIAINDRLKRASA